MAFPSRWEIIREIKISEFWAQQIMFLDNQTNRTNWPEHPNQPTVTSRTTQPNKLTKQPKQTNSSKPINQ